MNAPFSDLIEWDTYSSQRELTDYIFKIFKKQKTKVEEVSRVQELVQHKFVDQIEPETIKYAISR